MKEYVELASRFHVFLGSYSPTAGIPGTVHRLSEFIMRRDGGIPSDPENIYISPGSQWAVQVRVFLSCILGHRPSPDMSSC